MEIAISISGLAIVFGIIVVFVIRRVHEHMTEYLHTRAEELDEAVVLASVTIVHALEKMQAIHTMTAKDLTNVISDGHVDAASLTHVMDGFLLAHMRQGDEHHVTLYTKIKNVLDVISRVQNVVSSPTFFSSVSVDHFVEECKVKLLITTSELNTCQFVYRTCDNGVA